MANLRRIEDSEIPALLEQIRRERWTQLFLVSPRDELENLEYRLARGRLENAVIASPSQISPILAGLAHCDSLVALDLRGLRFSLSNLTELLQLVQAGRLPSLTQLRLSNNQFGAEGGVALALAFESGHLHSLTQLHLSNNEFGAEGGVALARAFESGHLHSLTQLHLSNNELGAHGGVALARALESGHLDGLAELNLSDNKLGAEGGVALARALESGHLDGLAELDLSDNKLGAEGGVALARALESGHLDGLEELHLSNNELGAEGGAALARALASGHLDSLTWLNLRDNKLGAEGSVAMARVLQDGMPPNFQSLGLSGNELGIEEEFLRSASPQQIAEAILHGQTVNEVRILFVGMGEVGKTWLAERCFEDHLIPKDRVRHETTDFNLVPPERCQFRPVLSLPGRSQVLTPRVWDFAGQMVTHGVHETFLADRPGQERTISILVLSAKRAVGSRRDPNNGHEIGNNLPYWLKTLANHAGPRAPVIVAISRCDGLTGNRTIDQIDGLSQRLIDFSPEELGRRFNVNVTAIIDRCSAVKQDRAGNPPVDRSIEPLRTAINEAAQQLAPALQAKVSPQFRKLRERVEQHLSGRRLIEITEFRSWCQEAGLMDSGDQEASLRILDQMGVVFFFGRTSREEERVQEAWGEHLDSLPVGRRRQEASEPDPLLQRYVINPHWLKTVVYQIIRKSESQRLLRDIELRAQVVEANTNLKVAEPSAVSSDELGVVKAFLKWTELCFYDDQERAYVFPRGYPVGATDTEGWTTSTLRWNYLPESAFHRFCVKMMQLDQQSGSDGIHIAKVNGVRQQWRFCIVLKKGATKFAVMARPQEDSLQIAVAPQRDARDSDFPKRWVLDRMQDILNSPPIEDAVVVLPADASAVTKEERMTPWFEDRPLDFTRRETQEMLQLLYSSYRRAPVLLALADDAGLDTTALDQDANVQLLARDMLGKARQSERLLQLIVVILNDPSQMSIHSDLVRLMTGYEAKLAAAALRRMPSLATLAMLPPSSEVWETGNASARPLDSLGLEKIINAVAGFADVAVFRQRLAEAEVRTARIEIGGKPRGTGFLVGESLLLTNWHVVKGGIDGAVARFDHKAFPSGATADPGRAVKFAADWLVASSPHSLILDEVGVGGPPAGTYDFALVRLSEPVASQGIGPDPNDAKADRRGHYQLDDSPYQFDRSEPLLIVGHPDGRPMQLSYASPADASFTTHRNRIRYKTNTEGGSSGSPVFNRDWRLVALHHAAGPTSIPGEFNLRSSDFNQGIPLADLVSFLKNELKGKPVLQELKLG